MSHTTYSVVALVATRKDASVLTERTIKGFGTKGLVGAYKHAKKAGWQIIAVREGERAMKPREVHALVA